MFKVYVLGSYFFLLCSLLILNAQDNGDTVDGVLGTESINQQMQGSVPGLYIEEREYTESLEALIRGKHSINLSNNPLFVLDGMPLKQVNTIADLEMLVRSEDIKSIKILKSASETARYGSRGSNGVIVIETK